MTNLVTISVVRSKTNGRFRDYYDDLTVEPRRRQEHRPRLRVDITVRWSDEAPIEWHDVPLDAGDVLVIGAHHELSLEEADAAPNHWSSLSA